MSECVRQALRRRASPNICHVFRLAHSGSVRRWEVRVLRLSLALLLGVALLYRRPARRALHFRIGHRSTIRNDLSHQPGKAARSRSAAMAPKAGGRAILITARAVGGSGPFECPALALPLSNSRVALPRRGVPSATICSTRVATHEQSRPHVIAVVAVIICRFWKSQGPSPMSVGNRAGRPVGTSFPSRALT
jgi:hypothetical protein